MNHIRWWEPAFVSLHTLSFSSIETKSMMLLERSSILVSDWQYQLLYIHLCYIFSLNSFTDLFPTFYSFSETIEQTILIHCHFFLLGQRNSNTNFRWMSNTFPLAILPHSLDWIANVNRSNWNIAWKCASQNRQLQFGLRSERGNVRDSSKWEKFIESQTISDILSNRFPRFSLAHPFVLSLPLSLAHTFFFPGAHSLFLLSYFALA